MVRLLYIHPGSVPPPRDESHDRFHFLSQICGGAVLLPVWWRTRSEAIEKFGSYPTFERGRFTYHFFLDMRWRGALGTVARTAFYVRQAVRLHRASGRFDAVMTYGTNSTGVASMLVSRLLRTPLIAEIPGVPEDAYLFDEPRVRNSHRLKHQIAQRAVRLVLTKADHAKLLYPNQLARYAALSGLPKTTFHDFVPVAGQGLLRGHHVADEGVAEHGALGRLCRGAAREKTKRHHGGTETQRHDNDVSPLHSLPFTVMLSQYRSVTESP